MYEISYEDYVVETAENHLEVWQTHYEGYDKEDIKRDLKYNYDWSGDNEAYEQVAKDNEFEQTVEEFQEAVIDEIVKQSGRATNERIIDALEVAVSQIRDQLEAIEDAISRLK